MIRLISIMGITVFFISGLFSFNLAEETESIAITTYYPSPYGVYDEMRANKMVIGDQDSGSTPPPSNGAITFNPTSQPSVYSEGTLYFDDGENCFKYYDGSAWKKLVGQ